jgi:ribosomal protein S18 acetylase RimI-like enzyme
MKPSITTRAATPQDDAFLYELFKAVRSPEFAFAQMAPAQLELLMSIQYAGQKATYGMEYPGGHDIVLLDREPIGRIWVHRGAQEYHLVDIALMPEFRNRGIGARLVTEAIAAALSAGLPLRCSIALNNPGSLRFHQRLGFEIAGRDDVYYDLTIKP